MTKTELKRREKERIKRLEKEYYRRANFYCRELWGQEYGEDFNINGRLTSTHGYRRYWKNRENPDIISLSKRLFDLDKKNRLYIDEVLLHELAHYSVHRILKKEGFYDGDKDFEDEIKRIGSTSTATCDIEKNRVIQWNKKEGRYERDKDYSFDEKLIELHNKYIKTYNVDEDKLFEL